MLGREILSNTASAYCDEVLYAKLLYILAKYWLTEFDGPVLKVFVWRQSWEAPDNWALPRWKEYERLSKQTITEYAQTSKIFDIVER